MSWWGWLIVVPLGMTILFIIGVFASAACAFDEMTLEEVIDARRKAGL